MRALASTVLCMVALWPLICRAGEWPVVTLPQGVQAFGVGDQLTLNGTSMRIRVFVSERAPSDLVARFRRSLGEPVVESRVLDKRILGRKQGDYYETIQLEPVGGGTRGTVAVTSLKSAQDNGLQTRARLEHWLSRLPAGTQVATDLVSRDSDRQSLYMVFVNTQTESLNHDRLLSAMADEGYRLERESAPAVARPGAGGWSMFFKGEGKEALATIRRGADGRSAIVLNAVNRLERFD